ncbi:sarcosine oxidase [Fragilaria crotonensis]|nr:sarcosine oxidase [Fragilaria crotonensis]
MLDVVVVGLGGVGSFCLRSLSKQSRGLRVAGIERYSRLHDRGSSHGGSRIYRKAYFEGPAYVPWIQYSEQVFRDELGEGIVENCGTLIVEEQGGPLIDSCRNSAQEWNIPSEFLTNLDLRHRYPQFKLASNNTVGLLEPGGGFIRPEKAMEAALNEAEANGAEILEEVIVDRLTEVDNHVEIHTIQNNSPGIMIRAKAVIIASGSWTSTLIPSWAPYPDSDSTGTSLDRRW